MAQIFNPVYDLWSRQAAVHPQVKDAHKKRLRLLQVEAALKGISAPPEILIEIENIKRFIKKSKLIVNRYFTTWLDTSKPYGI
jgi:hypothetical protein